MLSESRILKAPLPVAAGGWGQIQHGAYASASDPEYQRMAKLIEASLSGPLAADAAGTCGRETGCQCGNCWVRKLPYNRPAAVAAQE